MRSGEEATAAASRSRIAWAQGGREGFVPRGRRSDEVLSLHKLTAGTGYEYLTR